MKLALFLAAHAAVAVALYIGAGFIIVSAFADSGQAIARFTARAEIVGAVLVGGLALGWLRWPGSTP